MKTDTQAIYQPVLEAAEALMADRAGAPVRLTDPERLGGTKSRSCVLRCRVEGLQGGPSTVIVKRTLGDAGVPEADDGTSSSPLGRLAAEWAGGRLLEGVAGGEAIARGSYGVDPAARLILLEDLGPGSCLADHLQGDHADRLEEALIRYAAGMGRLHAATIGRESEYLEMRASLGVTAPPEPTLNRVPGRWYREWMEPLLAIMVDLGVRLPVGLERELQEAAAILEDPGPFLAFTPGDTCPDNHHVSDDGTLRFFDFEFSGFQHALLDAAYLRVPFPTCWCVNRLPEPLTEAAEVAYRAELVQGCPEAGDDAIFHRALAQACALWSLTTLTTGGELGLPRVLEADGDWGIASGRQRHLLRLDTLVTATERLGHLPAVGDAAFQLRERLRARWPGVEMPLYPPFRGQ